ncbi:hypothetical protein [uncultured Treponema sp.]|uniref:hypothetical protein n=1 Tax=uncultured Treponema sp. TaxID=162155 RepID=UPI0025FE9687|nr:hypothetical protein [uncultured Treponema sp.]
MKILKKLTISVLLFAGASAFTFALPDADKFDVPYIGKINDGLDDFAGELGFAVPQAAVEQNVYADAFIGKVFPAVPPHFAVGFNAGFTHLNTSGIADAADALGIDGVKSDMYFPVLNADVRVGGVFLPFDLGLSFMTLDVSSLNTMDADFTAEFFTFAVDARYALIEDGLITPGVSVGVGYSMNKGSFGASDKSAEVNVDYDVQTLYGQVQISKALNIPVVRIGFTPFLGLRGIISNYSNDWNWKVHNDTVSTVISALNVKTSGTNASDGYAGFQPQIYGGLGFNFMLIQVTASACADLRHVGGDTNLWSGALSLRLKM